MQVIALGFFDGVHAGHGALLRAARKMADGAGCEAAAMTFDTHPSALLGEAVPLLGTADDRRLLMTRLYGIDRMQTLRFDRAMMETPWRDFAAAYLTGAAGVVCGYDYRFGRRGEGTPELLSDFCAEGGIRCEVIPAVRFDGEVISSTRVRELLAAGDCRRAVQMLGHPHLISGTVAQGRHFGRTIGIPTANLPIDTGLAVPAHGVYAAKAELAEGEFTAVVNVGTHPTVGSTAAPQAEAWLPDYSGDLYGKPLRLWLYDRLREERKFPSADALRAQILRDGEQVRAFFG
ncbi:MAG: riboflavin biosynthesis protein RibF [Oscillospiraceae bacterium]|nr:riboflavin biosynthesis protein RibF [Oscillospiraceae bacterium]